MKKGNTLCILLLGVFIQQANAQFFSRVTGTALSSEIKDSRSINWVDVNNDGKLDLFISHGPSGGQNNSLFLNTGANSFSLMSADDICQDMSPSDGASFADVDNDETLDAFVANWYNQNNLFYTNLGNGVFLKHISEIISNDQGYSETASWGDYDKDGLVDLYVTNSAGSKKNYLYHNDGNLEFTKITLGDHVNDSYASRNVNWVDIDSDGDLDIFVTNENNQNENLYRNDGVTGFTKLTTGPLLNNGGNTNSSSWADIDNDGDLDVVLINDGGFNSLFLNNGNFQFTKVVNDTLVKTPSRSFSSAWSDIDNDGDLDLFVTNSFGPPVKQLNFLYINDGSGHFSRNSSDATVSDSSWFYGCAFGDYNNDGFEDLAVATVRFGGIDSEDFLYKNNGNTNNWITLKLTGTFSNKSAIGTKVRLKAVINGNPTWQMREVSSHSSYNGQNDMRVHFGLGNATNIDSIVVEWPSGIVENYTNVTRNQFIEYVEGAIHLNLERETLNQTNNLSIYPNPTKNKIHVELTNSSLNRGDVLRLINLSGQSVFSYTLDQTAKTLDIDVSGLNIKAGVYLLVLERNNKVSQLNKVLITN